jgi:hypothetical protein
MSNSRRQLPRLAVGILASAATLYRFTFTGPDLPGYTRVTPDTPYEAERGYGVEPGTQPGPSKRRLFNVDVPEGNCEVTVAFSDDKRPAVTTVTAQLRRLRLENVATNLGETVRRTFTVNVRTPTIPAVGAIRAGRVRLSVPYETVHEANAWDSRLTLEINGTDRRCAVSRSRLRTRRRCSCWATRPCAPSAANRLPAGAKCCRAFLSRSWVWPTKASRVKSSAVRWPTAASTKSPHRSSRATPSCCSSA